MIRFACCACGARLRAYEKSAGKTTRCQKCKVKVEIPMEDAPAMPGGINAFGDESEYDAEPVSLGDFLPLPAPPQMKVSPSICPACSLPILIDSASDMVQCPHCRRSLNVSRGSTNAIAPSSQAAAPPVPTITFRCPHCQAMQGCTADIGGQIAPCLACKMPIQMPVLAGQIGLSGASQITVNVSSPALPSRETQMDFGADGPLIHTANRRHANRGNGATALILGILGLIGCSLFGPLAIMFGAMAMNDDPDDGLGKAGYVLGWVSSGLLIITIVAVCVFWGALIPNISRR